MKISFKSFVLSAAALLGLAACQQEIAPEKPATATHTVTFVAETPQTKTTATITDGVVKYNWTEDDANTEGKFRVFENGNEASLVLAQLEEDGRMNITATFDGTSPTDAEYTAFFNSGVQTQQDAVKYDYDQNSDVLVAQAAKGDINQVGIYFAFKREVAFGKMTLKGLAEGDVVNNVTIKSDKPLAGTYSVSDWTETNNVINITTEVTANGEGHAEVWLTCIPLESAQFSVEATTAGGKTYTKEFAKPITLTQGNVKAFGVALEEKAEEVKAYVKVTTAPSDWTGEYLIVCESEKLAFDSNRDKLNDAPSNGHPSVTIVNNQIQATDELRKIAVKIAATEGGYSILAANGNYFDGTTKNKLNESAEPKANTISIDASANAVIKTGNNQLMYNGSNTSVFRYYATNQTPIQLYRLEKVTLVPVESISIKGETDVQVGRSIQLTAEINPSNANTGTELTWSSEDENIAKVEPKTGIVTGVAEGKVLVTVTSANGKTESCTVTVTAASTGGGPVLVYTLDTTNSATKGKDSAYDKAEDITVNDIIWNVTGNATMNPWRIGGKSLTNVNREVYTKTAYPVALQKIDLTVGAASSVTVNSCKLVYSTDSTFSNAKEVAFTFKASSTMPIIGDFPANCYYKFVFNVTITNSSNKFIEFKTVELYQ